MMKNFTHNDKLSSKVHESLKDHEVAFNPDDWNDMERRLDEQEKSKPGKFPYVAMVLVTVAALSGSYLIYSFSDSESKELATNQNTIVENGIDAENVVPAEAINTSINDESIISGGSSSDNSDRENSADRGVTSENSDEDNLTFHDHNSPKTQYIHLGSKKADQDYKVDTKENKRNGLFIKEDIFYPNNDNKVDAWNVTGEGIKLLSFKIYDEAGKKELMEVKKLPFVWDGTNNGEEFANGFYKYKIRYIDANDEPQFKAGFVEIVR